jgi:hypothetical protein
VQHQRDVRDLLKADASFGEESEGARDRRAVRAIDQLRAIVSLRAPLKGHLARLVRDLRDLRAHRALGYKTLADLLTGELWIAERSARRLVEIATVFDDAPLLEQEVASGSLAVGKALLAHRLGGGASLPESIARAQALTHLAWENEVGFLRLLRRCSADLGRRFPGPLPAPGLEEALIEEIRAWSPSPVTREEIEAELVGLFGPLRPEAGLDPAENPTVFARLRSLLETLVLRVWEDGTPFDRPTSAKLGLTVRVRFWAPWSVVSDFREAIGRIRDQAGPRMATWQAAILLVGTAARIWKEQEDPEAQKSLRARVLGRDGQRCVAPGCTRRRMLELHHGVFRSRGGTNDPENLWPLCYGHHQRVIHAGYARLRGRAPQEAEWELGCAPDAPPLRRYRGQKLVEVA